MILTVVPECAIATGISGIIGLKSRLRVATGEVGRLDARGHSRTCPRLDAWAADTSHRRGASSASLFAWAYDLVLFLIDHVHSVGVLARIVH